MTLSFDPSQVRFDENGLVSAVVQDAISKEVLTLAYMNEASLKKTLETGQTWFWSRSRQELWHKGATSGHVQKVVSLALDCDGDALVARVIPAGPACHTGNYSCFTEPEAKSSDRFAILNSLERVIARREAERPEGSYTTSLFEGGVDRILKKVGEEATEVVIAAKNRSGDELRWESADLLFHWLVLLREQGLSLDEVLRELEQRHGPKPTDFSR
ncbi:bifunctional phosphoribosyl-AMP cyclohydrolase/phosphoribosyl-ATP diphosphatase HisIE [Desmospora profundinema]|uniref:Histidine biosynthesis bifunctional protein HisIE n=1 Tax=Desmospora profundinema TaxID=1571184 RepID=A0ABU1IM55_9BACL|nr:bifunctional phosphoribosyl-AMP cyclohydrolase/phosphoribosyl-ATP diphosphatase HisIE [Desmospora profundinema]MDR6225637.1 phosphoribosyl-ATP pyrophosphohydrolase/phosphoribosyl-AMP cyclohydrolase [Desmospora profundinema]